jgi:hypothetical protein
MEASDSDLWSMVNKAIFCGIFPYIGLKIGLIYGSGTSNQSVPDMVIDHARVAIFV